MPKVKKVRKEEKIGERLSFGITLIAFILYAFITIWFFILYFGYGEIFSETEKSLLIISGFFGIAVLSFLLRDIFYYYNKIKKR